MPNPIPTAIRHTKTVAHCLFGATVLLAVIGAVFAVAFVAIYLPMGLIAIPIFAVLFCATVIVIEMVDRRRP
jgi:hypothetical protein